MKILKVATLEALFVLGFGIFHFALPFVLPPNFNSTSLFGFIPLGYFVIPGCFTLAAMSIVFFFKRNQYLAVLLALLYSGGITFHALYISGLFPPVLVVPTRLTLVGGIVIDSWAIFAIYDCSRRVPLISSLIGDLEDP